MLGVVLQKIRNKKWLFACLLLGSVLLIATAASFPMYRNAVFNRMLQDEMLSVITEEGRWPMQVRLEGNFKKADELKKLAAMENMATGLYEKLGAPELRTVYYYTFAHSNGVPELTREGLDGYSLRTGFLTGIEDHITLVDGRMYSESGIAEDGCLEAVISETTMLTVSAVLGDVYEFPYFESESDGKTLKVRVVGVFKKSNEADLYWPDQMRTLTSCLFVREDVFREKVMEGDYPDYTLSCQIFDYIDYEHVEASSIDQLIEVGGEISGRGVNTYIKAPKFLENLENYKAKENRISITLVLLQVPLLLLLCAFLIMLSGQLFELEQNEISVLRSRGASKGQIFLLYLEQGLLLSAVGMIPGIPLGQVFCRILGSASNFLEFGVRRELDTRLVPAVWVNAAGAALLSAMMMTLPVIKLAKVSIVHSKSSRARSTRSWWEKSFLDLLFTGIALYGYYSYSQNTDRLTESALKGEGLDPLLYFSSTLFILGVGMLALRLQPLIVKFLFFLRKKTLSPAGFASFLEVIRNGRKQQYIMLFMILTVSLGMFDAVSARTILQNTLNNTEYLAGADIRLKEVWPDNSSLVAMDPSVEFEYTEPDYSRYAELTEFATGYTKVQMNQGYIPLDRRSRQGVDLMGIHTREFGEITTAYDELLSVPYHELLNRLAMDAQGVLLSSNFRDILGYQEGDVFHFYNDKNRQASGFILGFFEYWPGYVPTTKRVDDTGTVQTVQHYQVVTNFAMMQKYFDLSPYQVWIGAKNSSDTSFVYDWVDSHGVRLAEFADRNADLKGVIEDPLLQGMNGVLTMSFIVMLILCAVGYLIYWILSIRSRELLMGVLRAIGMHKSELFHILINEQIFSGMYSIAAGVGIGIAAYKLYVPMLQMAYSTTEQVLPLEMITQTSDMVRLYSIVGLTMAVCLGVLAFLVKKLNITKALKLGEE